MARVLFTVCGVGFGHASRSEIVINHLKKNHEVAVTAYSEGFEYLKGDFSEIKKLEWFKYYFDKNKIARIKTIALNIPKLPNVFIKNFFRLSKIVKEFKPDVIVSDFDSNGLYAGKIFGIPVILVSNMHLAEYFKVEDLSVLDRLVFELTDKMMLRAYFCADHFLITSIMKPESKKKNTFFFHPVVRESLAKEKTSFKDFYLCYASLKHLAPILPALKQLKDTKFVVYGHGKKPREKNIVFKNFSKKSWLSDMKKCRGLLCHGGLLSISEAVILKKPVYVTATMDWFERFHNGKMVQALGFGQMERTPTKKGIQSFIDKNDYFIKKLKKENIKPANKEFFKVLDSLIEMKTKKV